MKNILAENMKRFGTKNLNERYLGFGKNQGKKAPIREDQEINDAINQIVDKLVSINIISIGNKERAKKALEVELRAIRFGGDLGSQYDSTGIKDTELMPGEPDQYKDLTKGYGKF